MHTHTHMHANENWDLEGVVFCDVPKASSPKSLYFQPEQIVWPAL